MLKVSFGKGEKPRLVYGRTPEETQAAKELALLEFQAHRTRLTPASPLSQVAEMIWIPRIERLEPATFNRYRAAYAHIHVFMGGTPISLVKPPMVQAFVNHLETKMVSRSGKGKAVATMSPAGVRFVYSVLSQIMKLAYESELTSRNPCGLLVSKPKPPRKRDRGLSILEAADVLENAPESLKLPLFAGLILGLRLGEIAGLKWDDLDRMSGVLKIRRQVRHNGQIGELKTQDSRRDIPLPREFVDFIDKWGDLDHPEGFICPITRRQIVYRYNRWEGKPKDWTFHDTRHGATGLSLISTGGDIIAAKDQLGHGKIETTMGYVPMNTDRILQSLKGLTTVLNTDSNKN